MLPAAICLGFATGIAWSSATHFVTVLANDHEFASDDLFSAFTGVVQFSSIAGNLVAVGIVKNYLQEPRYEANFVKYFSVCLHFRG